MKKLFQTKLYIALISLVVVFLIGTLYFRFHSDYSWVDSIYFTVITATTVGFKEVHPLTESEHIGALYCKHHAKLCQIKSSFLDFTLEISSCVIDWVT